MRTKATTFFLIFHLLFISTRTSAQTSANGQVMANLPDSIINLIKSSPKKDLISVIGRYEVSSQVIKTDNLVFHNNSELVLTDYSVPYIIIVAKNLKFNAPAVKSRVKFGDYNLESLKGKKGNDGARGANGTGNGGRGSNGSNGSKGGKGKTKHTPDIYLIVENINTDFGDISTFDWQVFSNGLAGGQGGDGGNGGKGGSGSDGRNSRSNAFHCTRGAGDGGRGGDGGSGGQGGDGGIGGNAGNIILVGTPDITQKLTYVQYSLSGGNGGRGGNSGNSGDGGSGGSGGEGSTHCSGGDRGGKGRQPATLGQGQQGQKGKTGDVKIVNTTLANLF